MKRMLLVGMVVTGLVAAGWSASQNPLGKTFFPSEARNPVTHLSWNDDPAQFAFALVSDRTGGHRAEVFSQAVEKLNLLQPAFVMSVGDLIEGSTNADALKRQWREFDGYVERLTMPFFYVAGNHDVGSAASAKFWEEKQGRRYYHFLLREVLFVVLNSDDPPGSNGRVGPDQVAYAQKVLQENQAVRWTVVVIHRPLWVVNDGAKNGWRDVEQALAGRPYTVFAGHVHRYKKFVRQGQNYYQLATTGGSSLMRGPEVGEFDHLTWVTMKKDGPVLANLMLDAIQRENLRSIRTDEAGTVVQKKLLYPVRGRAYFEGTPMPGAEVVLTNVNGGTARGSRAVGVVAADGSFTLSTYTAHDGAPAGKYTVVVSWRDRNQGKSAASQLPVRYGSGATSGLTATIQPGDNELVLELRK